MRPLPWGVRSPWLVFSNFECCSFDVNRDDAAYQSVTQQQRARAWGRYSVSQSVKWFHSSTYAPPPRAAG